MVTIWGWQTQSPYEDMERSNALSCPRASQPQTAALRRGSTWSHCPMGVTNAEGGQSPVQGGTQPPALHTAPASTPHLGDALTGKRAEPCPWMPWTGQGAWAGPHLLPPNPHLPQSVTCSTHGPHPVHPWGAHMAGFALTQQMPAGARAEPPYFPGWRVGASLQASGAEPPPAAPPPPPVCRAQL